MSLRSTTRPLYFYFWCFASNSAFSNDICPSVRQHELLRPSSLLHRSPLIYFWLSSGPTLESFSSFSHSLSTAAFAAGIFMAWGILNCKALVNCLLFLQYGPQDDWVEILPYAVLWIHWLPGYTQVLIWSQWFCHGSPHSCSYCMSCKA